MTKSKAFSLIEMLIVMSIAAIISAIAFAQYRNYSMRAKISQAMIIFKNIGDKAKEYYDKNGRFPNLQEINMLYDPLDPTQSLVATSLGEYTANYVPYTFLVDQSGSFTCPAAGYGGYISNLFEGDYLTQTQNGSVITINLMLVYVGNTFRNYCQYFYYLYDPQTQDLTPQSGKFIPSCENGTDDPDSANFFNNVGNQC